MNKTYIKVILGVLLIVGLVVILKLQGHKKGSPEPVQTHSNAETVSSESLMLATDKPLVNIKRIIKQDNTYSLEYDEVEWLDGDVAAKAAFADKQCEELIYCAPGGFYIRNTEVKLQKLPVSASAKVVLQNLSPSGPIENPALISLAEFQKIYENFSPTVIDIPFHLKIESGKITRIEEQYTP